MPGYHAAIPRVPGLLSLSPREDLGQMPVRKLAWSGLSGLWHFYFVSPEPYFPIGDAPPFPVSLDHAQTLGRPNQGSCQAAKRSLTQEVPRESQDRRPVLRLCQSLNQGLVILAVLALATVSAQSTAASAETAHPKIKAWQCTRLCSLSNWVGFAILRALILHRFR